MKNPRLGEPHGLHFRVHKKEVGPHKGWERRVFEFQKKFYGVLHISNANEGRATHFYNVSVRGDPSAKDFDVQGNILTFHEIVSISSLCLIVQKVDYLKAEMYREGVDAVRQSFRGVMGL